MPRVRYQGPYDVTRIPALRDKDLQRADVTGYKNAAGPKAVAFHAEGIFRVVTGAASQTAAEEQALQACNTDPVRRGGMSPCVLYASGDRVVLPMRATAPISGGAAPAAPKPAVAAAKPAPIAPPPAGAAATTLNATLVKVAPALADTARTAIVAAYSQERQNRALAAFPPAATWRTSNWASAAVAEERALEACQLRYGGPCVLVAINDTLQPAPSDGNWPRRDMPRMAFDGEFDVAQLPIVNEAVRARLDVAGYRVQPAPKAVAIHPQGKLFVTVGAADQREAERKALETCNTDPERSGADGPCYLYAIGDRVVLRQRATEPLSKPPEVKPAAPAENPLAATIATALSKAAPSLSESVRTSIATSYAQERQHKALAVYPPSATWRFSGIVNAASTEERVLEGCQLRYGGPCFLLAVNDNLQPTPADGSWPRRDMPRLAYDGMFDVKLVPIVSEIIRQRADIAGYREQRAPKAMALHPQGRIFAATGVANQREAEQKALSDCNTDPLRGGRDGPCFLYAVGDQVVLRQRRTTPLTTAP